MADHQQKRQAVTNCGTDWHHSTGRSGRSGPTAATTVIIFFKK
jgi:hypothetical protein